MGRILAFDFGLKRVGVAVTDPLQLIANSMDTVPTAGIYDFIKTYCAKEEVEAFVIGYPYNHGGGENYIVPHIEAFIKKLESLYPGKQIHKVDERFTSKIAAQTLLLSGVNKKERQKKGNVDAIAANLILQSFLEMR